MGLTKQYLRYVPGPVFGSVSSGKAIHFQGNLVLSAAAENVILWNVKTEERHGLYDPGEENKGKVTSIALHGSSLAVGYEDGNIKLFLVDPSESIVSSRVTLAGHKSPVLALNFDEDGGRLASGGADTILILWDVVNECGLFRLSGHKGPITQTLFMKRGDHNVLLTSSKDTTIKFWDLSVKHCFKTFPGHLTEVWDMALIKQGRYLITGSADSELRVFKLRLKEDDPPVDKTTGVEPAFKHMRMGEEDTLEEGDDEEGSRISIERMGSLLRAGTGRTYSISVDDKENVLAVHGNDNVIEIFKICDPEEIKKRLSKKAKKARRQNTDEDLDSLEPTIQEEFRRLQTIRVGGKLRSIALRSHSSTSEISVLASTANNLLALTHFNFKDKNSDATGLKVLSHPGHRSDVRTLSFSGDNTAIASVSHESLKVWNRTTQTCIRTIESGYGLCSAFVVGDRQLIVGTKTGSLQLFDLNSSQMTEEIHNAHEGEIWSLCQTPNKDGFVTASADKSVKFWILEFVEKEDKRILSLVHTRTLQLDQDVLSVKLSPDGRLIAVSLLDVKIKVFFVDSFKLLHDLFGHKLPSLAIDISHDSSILVSASADRNVKIWDLNHGQVEKSMFAHEDSIVGIQFVPNTHLFFTIGKDGTVKQWDADKFERILTLRGHHGEIRALAISSNGNYVVTAGHDKTLRLWEKTQEPLVLEDERETEREIEAEAELAMVESRYDCNNEANHPTKKTSNSENSADRLIEAIHVYREYIGLCETDKNCPLPPLMMMYGGAKSPEDFMCQTLAKIRSADLEESLLVLPLGSVIHLLGIIDKLLSSPSPYIEVLSRTFFFLIEIHFGPLSSSSGIISLIKRLRDLVNERLEDFENVIGFNMASLIYMKNCAQEKQSVELFADASEKYKEKRKKKKRKQKALQTAIMTI